MVTPDLVRRAVGRMRMGKPQPLWLDTVSRLYPPVTFALPPYMKRTRPGRVPKPPTIAYPEDAYRQRFFETYPLETLRETTMDERTGGERATDNPDVVFRRQTELMAQGVAAEDAYQLSLAEYTRHRKTAEMEARVAQEQFLEHAAVPASKAIEDLLMEEKTVLAEAVRNKKHQSSH